MTNFLHNPGATGYGYALRTRPALQMILAALVCGVAIGTSYGTSHGQTAPAVIVCEAGTFEPADDDDPAADPYLRLTAECTVTDAHGRPATVLVID